ncbi:MAG: hypothetical protein SH850_24365 [Planctomycetaceae bacterium]|nr:hypothetical protein [Planctomycetaceae bacterium]
MHGSTTFVNAAAIRRSRTLCFGILLAAMTVGDTSAKAANLAGDWTLNFNTVNADPHTPTLWVFEKNSLPGSFYATQSEQTSLVETAILGSSFGRNVFGIVIFDLEDFAIPGGILVGQTGSETQPAQSLSFTYVGYIEDLDRFIIDQFDGTRNPPVSRAKGSSAKK